MSLFSRLEVILMPSDNVVQCLRSAMVTMEDDCHKDFITGEANTYQTCSLGLDVSNL